MTVEGGEGSRNGPSEQPEHSSILGSPSSSESISKSGIFNSESDEGNEAGTDRNEQTQHGEFTAADDLRQPTHDDGGEQPGADGGSPVSEDSLRPPDEESVSEVAEGEERLRRGDVFMPIDSNAPVFVEEREEEGQASQSDVDLMEGSSKDFVRPLLDGVEPENYCVDDLEEKIEGLKRNPFLVIACEGEKILDSVQAQIASDPSHFGFGKWTLGDRDSESPDDLRSFGDIAKWRSRQPSNTILFVMPEKNDQDLVDSILAHLVEDESNGLTLGTSKKKCRIVCLLRSEQVRERHSTLFKTGKLWEVDFVLPSLRQYAGTDEEKAQSCASRVMDQLTLWPADNKEFFDRLTSCLDAGGIEHLEGEIARLASGFKQDDEINLVDLERDCPVKLAIFFTVANFPGLSISGFTTILETLLASPAQPVEIQETPKVIESLTSLPDHEKKKGKKKKKGKGKGKNKGKKKKGSTPEVITQELPALTSVDESRIDDTQYWRQNSDSLMRSCKLRVCTNGDGSQFVDFKDPLLRKSVLAGVKSKLPFYQSRQFEKLLRSGLLFDPETEDDVASQLIELAGVIASSNHDSYAHKMLEEIDGAITRFSNQSKISSSDAASMPAELLNFFRLLEQVSKAGAVNFFYRRLAEVCSEYLRHDRTRDSVREFLDRRMKSKDTDRAEIVLRIVRRLRNTRGFDYYKWISDIFNSSRPKTRVELCQDLLREANQSDASFERVTTVLRSWHPENGSFARTSIAARYSLAFLFLLHIKNKASFSNQANRMEGFTHPFFSSETLQSERQRTERARMLSDWLLHPIFVDCLEWVLAEHLSLLKTPQKIALSREIPLREDPTEGGRPELTQATLVAELVYSWSETVESSKPPDPCAIDCCEQLLANIMQRISGDKKAFREIHKYWTAKKVDYDQQLRACPRKNIARREALKQAKQRLLKLRKTLDGST